MLAPILILGALGVVVLITTTAILKSAMLIVGPNEVLVLAGQPRGDRGYRVMRGGRAVKMPLIEKAATLDLTNMVIEVKLDGALSRDFVPLDIGGVANLKIAGTEPVLDRAVARLLGMPRGEIVAHLARIVNATAGGVVARLTALEVASDRENFANCVLEEAEQQVRVLGVDIDTLRIQSVTDGPGYLSAFAHLRVDAHHGAQAPMAVGKAAAVPSPAAATAAPGNDAPRATEPPAFRPQPELVISFSAVATDPAGGARVTIELGASELVMRPWSPVDGGAPLATIHLTSELEVALSQTTEGTDTLLHVEVSQERLGARVQLGLSSTTRTFSNPVTDLRHASHRFPWLEEADMQRLLAGLRATMRARGADRWHL